MKAWVLGFIVASPRFQSCCVIRARVNLQHPPTYHVWMMLVCGQEKNMRSLYSCPIANYNVSYVLTACIYLPT
jgi:hypothetical protein